MSRYIDADAFDERVRISVGLVEEELTEDYKDGVRCTLELLKTQPTADVVEVIRCKECKHYRKNISCVGGLYNGCSEWLNEGNEIEVREDGFCSYGERREDDKE